MSDRKPCAIEGCEKPSLARGWCSKHWERWKRHGNPLSGRAPNGEPERYLREVVLAYKGDECLPWPYSKTADGYGNLRQKGGYEYVHRIACEAINGPPPSPDHDAAHSCGNGHLACATMAHLDWKTRSENIEDARKHGTLPIGDRHYSKRQKLGAPSHG